MLAAVGIVVIALAIALPLALIRAGGTTTTETVAVSTSEPAATSTTTEPTTEVTEPPTSDTTAPTSTTSTSEAASDIPGDSAGSWAETSVSGLDLAVDEVALSNEALLFRTGDPAGDRLFGYIFASQETVELPIELATAGSLDIDGLLVVWREGAYDADNNPTEGHIYAYLLPDGPRIEVASGTQLGMPQVSGGVIAWTEVEPWATAPDEYADITIKGADIDEQGQPTGSSVTLVESAIASVIGDSTWTYDLSGPYLSWEQHSSAGAFEAGSYMMDLGQMQPWLIDNDAWRPSVTGDQVVFTRNGLEVSYFAGNDAGQIDPAGDFATAAPTYVAYFRPKPSGDGTAWAVVTRGLTTGKDQVLLEDTGSPPWFLSPIATATNRLAFTIDGTLHLFEWQE